MNKTPKIDERRLKRKTKTIKTVLSNKTIQSFKSQKQRTSSFDSFKKNKSSKPTKDEVSVEFESIGEEGFAQVVRSPVAKRGNSSTPESLTKVEGFLMTERIVKLNFDECEKCSQELRRLKQENQMIKMQLAVVKQMLMDAREKLELTERTCRELGVINFKLMDKNKELRDEVEKLKGNACENCKVDLQFELEEKVLSLFKEKEEKYEMYLGMVGKLNRYLCEFATCEEWVLSLASCPFVRKEIEDCEDGIRARLLKIKEEINLCQAILKTDRFVDNSYFTSISSSIVPSPSHSPRG